MSHNRLFVQAIFKSLCIFLSIVFMCLNVGCITSTEEHIQMLENYLSTFTNKTIRDVINVFGQPTSYNSQPYIANNYLQYNSALMIYNYKKTKDCILIFEYNKTTTKITNSYYQGNCFLIR